MLVNKNSWLLNVPIAHRGLWSNTVTENSITAYERAIAHGFAIEIDVFLTKDKIPVCFHDENLERMTGENALIYDKTLKELKQLSLKNSGEKIPTLDEVLSLCEKKAPLLIELKNQPDKEIVNVVTKRLKAYKGEFAVQSFNPLYLMKLKKLAPEYTRGILGSSDIENCSILKKFVVKKMPLNTLVKPHFISYYYKDFPIKNKGKLPTLAWTVTDKETAKKLQGVCDNIIFENFTPD